jgi:FKBP-type peptidyl-prolyl cis-trans isomerase
MKLNLQKAVIVILFITFSTMAEELTPSTTPVAPPDKEKVSYALGMQMGLELKPACTNLDIGMVSQAIKDGLEGKPAQYKESEMAEALNSARENGLNVATLTVKGRERISYILGMQKAEQLKRTGAEVSADVMSQGFKDVLEGKPTKIQESEIQTIFMKAEAYTSALQAKKNREAGEAFLAKNAKAPGVKVLPDGLQYRVIQEGKGEIPTTSDLLIVKYKAKLINGTVFDRKNVFVTRSNGGIQGLQDALQRMKVGSKWEIFVPSNLAFGNEGEPALQVGPDATLIYELEVVSIAQPGDPLVGTGTLGHGLEGAIPEGLNSSSNPAK